MPNKFASGKYAIAECDRCAQRYMLKELRTQILKTKPYKVKVCRTCWDPDQPQLSLGLYPVNDPQAVREPRPDVSYQISGQSGLQINITGVGPDGFGSPELGSRIIQWGWNPVGGSRGPDAGLTPNDLVQAVVVGTVTVTTTQELKMGYKKGADGITKTGKTDAKVFPNDGKHIIDKGPKANKSSLNKNMKSMGRNMARMANQRGR